MEAATLMRPEPAPALRVRPAPDQPRREPPNRPAPRRDLIRPALVLVLLAGARVVIEPQVPDDWATDVGTYIPWAPKGESAGTATRPG